MGAPITAVAAFTRGTATEPYKATTREKCRDCNGTGAGHSRDIEGGFVGSCSRCRGTREQEVLLTGHAALRHAVEQGWTSLAIELDLVGLALLAREVERGGFWALDRTVQTLATVVDEDAPHQRLYDILMEARTAWARATRERSS